MIIQQTMSALFSALCCTVLIATCTSLEGPGSETIALSGSAQYSGKVPAAYAKVRLRTRNHLMDTSGAVLNATIVSKADRETDGAGKFYFASVPRGEYSIEINDGISRAAILRCSTGGGSSTIELPTVILTPTSTITGTIDSGTRSGAEWYARVYGLDRVARVNNTTGEFIIPGVPEGQYRINIVSSLPQKPPITLDSVLVPSGGSVALPYASWPHSKQLFLNTTASGAAVSGMVVRFPVLVRLTSSNFHFSEAGGAGNDLRFTKANGDPLPFEIEQWDSANSQAEVWVAVDTIFGNDSTHAITMHWGNRTAAGNSSSGAVFDTADGFRGVWHLGESAGMVTDATADRYSGSRNGNLARIAGIIGYGQTCGGAGDYTEMGDVLNPGVSSFTVSAWIKRSGIGLQTLMAKSNGGTPSSSYGWLISLDVADKLHCFMATGGTTWGDTGNFNFYSSSAITDLTAWHHIAAVFDRSGNNGCRLYLDGSDVTDTIIGDITRIGALTTSAPMRIGSESTGKYPWKGSLDECVVSYAARSADWIRLCYMNQRKDDKLVVFK